MLAVLQRRHREMLETLNRTSTLPQEKLTLGKLATQRVRNARKTSQLRQKGGGVAALADSCGKLAGAVVT